MTLAERTTTTATAAGASLPKTARMAVITGPRQLELREVPTPEPGPGQVLMRVRATGLCTWEQRSYTGTVPVHQPFCGGHETSGEIVAIGPGTRTGLKVGDHVGTSTGSCGECYYCRRGYPARCALGFMRSEYAGAWGPMGLSDYKLAQPQTLYKLAPDLPWEAGCFTEPVSCVVHAARHAETWLGQDVVVIGAGVMGALNIMVSKRLGARVIAVERDPRRCERARAFGADVVVDTNQQDAAAVVKGLTEGRGADVVIGAFGSGSVNDLAIGLVGKTGRVMVFASAYPASPLDTDPNVLHKSEIAIVGIEGKNQHDSLVGAKLLSDRTIDPRPLIESRLPLARIEEAFELAVRPETYRVIVEP
jgi:L-iditol 2-dehydrogenase